MDASLEQWALPRLQQLLPLDDESLKQVLQYASSLPKDASAEHLKNLLGDESKSLEFISSFNMRRPKAPASSTVSSSTAADHHASPDVPRAAKSQQKKKKPNIHALPARQIQDRGHVSGAYQKRAEEDYMPAGSTHHDHVAEKLALRRKPDATQLPLITDQATPTARPITSKAPPSASGPLVSDSLSTKKGAVSKASAQSSRTSSPAPKAKVNISGGTAMHGASTALSDLDSAIRSLELQTNPSLSVTSDADNEKRKCNCMATRHQLLDMAPNCLQCGKIICVKEGLGPCTYCGSSLLSAEDIHKVLRVLKDERGEERMNANNASHKRAEVSQGKARAYTGRDFLTSASFARPSPFSSQPATPAESDDEATEKAKAHRDKLLGFQANNARRTQIHDEAADFDVPVAGTNVWASPHERAQQLKKQQRVLREMEWNAKPEYEKRRVVASIDLKGGKVVRRMADLEKPDFEVPEDAENHENADIPSSRTEGGAFSHNPLASGLIRPTARETKGKEIMKANKHTWRRVQMDEDDNEQWILDGGLYGEDTGRSLGNEPACG
ncbi:related to C2HC5 finger [Lecanosticta acicola]|uniref:Related to C2HC5 finger n=1 Tax=Lecanosticta acicola TaxID=111012 RepID=A0AAI8Z2Z6_9PEZI|nr:related to C2HC5 finger [Lecanosticta acicola]